MTVTVTRRCEGYSCGGAVKLPEVTPDCWLKGWVWQTPPGQCSIATVHLNADAGIVPCCASLALALNVIWSPTAQVSAAVGVTVPRTGALLPAWICWVAVAVWPWPSFTSSLAVQVPAA